MVSIRALRARHHAVRAGGLLAASLLAAATLAVAPNNSSAATGVESALPPDLVAQYGSTPAYADEFNGSSVNLTDWYYRLTGPYAGGYMTADAVTVSGGALRLNYSQRDVSGDGIKDFVSGGLISRRLFGYGYYEIRARLYDGAAPLHTSFWSMGIRSDLLGALGDPRIKEDIANSVLPEHNHLFEIDGFEHDSPDRLGMGNVPGSHGTVLARHPYMSGAEYGVNFADWNVYGYEYTPQTIKFYINGILRFTIDNAATKYEYAPMNFWLTALPFFPKATDTVTPGSSDFDYFRYYNRPQPGVNLLGNPSFDALPRNNPGAWLVPGWIESDDRPASQIATDDVVNGGRSLLHTGTSAYSVTTKQDLTGIPDGRYTLTAWVKSSAGRPHAQMRVLNHGGSERAVAIRGSSEWTRVTIRAVPVTNGKATIAFTSHAAANEWLRVDNVSFTRN